MGYPQYPIITDELLSAYIDNAVNDAEREAVETAIANDLEIAWRVESLRSTVSILGQLADVPLPRSFTLNDALLETASVNETPRQAIRPHSSGSFWDNWLDFWRSGSLIWRNAAAISALLLVVFLVGDIIVGNDMSVANDEMATSARTNSTDVMSTNPVAVADGNDVVGPAAVAIIPEPTAGLEEQSAPEPVGAIVAIDDMDAEAETEEVQPVAVALKSEQGAGERIVPAEEGPSGDAPSDHRADDAIQPEMSASGEPQMPPAAPVALSAARVSADSIMAESTSDLSATAGDGADEPAADLLFAASAIGEDESAGAEDGENSAPLPAGAVEPVAPESTDAESTNAEPVADVAVSTEAETQPQAMMLTDASVVETEMVEEEMVERGDSRIRQPGI